MATFFQKVKLFQSILTGNANITDPIFVTFDATRRCNLRCVGCPYHSPHAKRIPSRNSNMGDMPLSLVRQICDQLKAKSTRIIVIEGSGEPFMNPDILEIISTIKAASFSLTILTNGTLLDRSVTQFLIEKQVDVVKVSLWANSVEGYVKNHPGVDPDNFRKVIDGLNLFAYLKAERKSRFPEVWIHNPINRYNFQSLHAMVDLAIKARCNGLSYSPLINFRGTLDHIALSEDEERLTQGCLWEIKKRLNSLSIKHNIDHLMLRYKIGEKVWEKIPCYIAWTHSRISVDGIAHPCCRCELELGNLYKTSFSEYWDGQPMHTFRQQTRTKEGLVGINSNWDCRFCWHAPDNHRIHQVLKWFRR